MKAHVASDRGLHRRGFLRLVACGAISGALAALAGCGSPPPPEGSGPPPTPIGMDAEPAPAQGSIATPAPSPPTASRERTLVFGFWDGSIRPLIEQFERDNPNVRVRFIPEGYESLHRGLGGALSVGKGAPDVVIVADQWLGALVDRGGLTDLTAPPFDGARIAKDFARGAWDLAAVEGRQRAIPFATFPALCFWRTDLLAAAGLESDAARLQARLRTWDDVVALGRDLRQRTPDVALTPDAVDIFVTAVTQQPYGWVDENRLQIVEKMTLPATLGVEIRHQGLEVDSADRDDFRGLVTGDRAALFMGPAGLVAALNEFAHARGAWRILPPPGGPAWNGGLYLVIPEQSREQELAWELAHFLTTNIGTLDILLQQYGYLPAYRPAWAEPFYQRRLEMFGGQQVYRLFAEAVDQMTSGRISPYDGEIIEQLQMSFLRIFQRDEDPEKVLRSIEQTLISRHSELVE